MKKVSINVRYIIMQGAFFLLFCAAAGFISLFLQGIGFSESQIGVSVAVFSMITAAMQPIMGNISDRVKFFTWKRMLTYFSIIIIIVNILMIWVDDKGLKAVLLGIFFITGSLAVPFINSAHYYYESIGEKIDFGVARGMGSGTFAVGALIIGNFANKFGIITIPYTGLITAILYFFTVLWLPYFENVEDDSSANIPTTKVNLFNFIKKYPTFSLMLISVFFMYFSHNLIGIYLLQLIQSLEGNSGHLGAALAIQAIFEIPMLFAFTYIMKKVKVSSLMVISSVGYVVKAVMYAISTSVSMVYFAQTFQIFSFAILVAASVYYTGRMVSKEEQTTGQSLMASMSPAAMVAGSLAGGWMIEKWGISTMLIFNVVISAIGLLIGLLANASYKKRIID